jgi:hypothetical protein
MKILAFGHQKNTGKDSIVRFCIDILRPQTGRLRITRRGFADKLYDFLHSVYGWAGFRERSYYQDNPKAKDDVLKNGYTVRDLLIKFGNHARQFDGDIWLNANLKAGDADILFITDLRFPNEFEACQAAGAVLIRVTKADLPTPTDEADTALNGWEDRWHTHIANDGTLNDLYQKAHALTQKHLLV